MNLRDLSLIMMIFAELHCSAQIEFSIADLPAEVGDYRRAYASTGAVSVAGRLGRPGGQERWDFSEAQRANEFVRRKDIVQPTDGEHGTNFPNSTYAERITVEGSGARSWNYYRIGQGRAFYGFHEPQANPLKPTTVFDAPTIDLPDSIRYGESWMRTADWVDLIDAGFGLLEVDVHFTAKAVVDAWGTVVLPGGAECSALRVNEEHHYELTERAFGLRLPDQFSRYYYWLVRGIGPAVEILSPVQSSPPRSDIDTAADVQRVFLVRPWSVSDLRIRLQDGHATLTWRAEADTTGYRVETKPDLTTAEWTILAQPIESFWMESELLATGPFRFFRVLVRP